MGKSETPIRCGITICLPFDESMLYTIISSRNGGRVMRLARSRRILSNYSSHQILRGERQFSMLYRHCVVVCTLGVSAIALHRTSRLNFNVVARGRTIPSGTTRPYVPSYSDTMDRSKCQ